MNYNNGKQNTGEGSGGGRPKKQVRYQGIPPSPVPSIPPPTLQEIKMIKDALKPLAQQASESKKIRPENPSKMANNVGKSSNNASVRKSSNTNDAKDSSKVKKTSNSVSSRRVSKKTSKISKKKSKNNLSSSVNKTNNNKSTGTGNVQNSASVKKATPSTSNQVGINDGAGGNNKGSKNIGTSSKGTSSSVQEVKKKDVTFQESKVNSSSVAMVANKSVSKVKVKTLSASEAAAKLSLPWPPQGEDVPEMDAGALGKPKMSFAFMQEMKNFLQSNQGLLTKGGGWEQFGGQMDDSFKAAMETLALSYMQSALNTMTDYKPVKAPKFSEVETNWPGFEHKPVDNWKEKYTMPQSKTSTNVNNNNEGEGSEANLTNNSNSKSQKAKGFDDLMKKRSRATKEMKNERSRGVPKL